MGAVIAITGSMGAGKSTVVRHLVDLLPRAVAVHEDDHQSMTNWSADEVRHWQESGGEIGHLPLEGLPDRLRALRTGGAGQPGLVVLESQFGRHHPALAELVDFQIWLDVPADVALARKIAQFAGQAAGDASARLAWIAEMSGAYADWTAALVHRQRATVPAASDAIVEGDAPAPAVVDSCLAAIGRFRGDA